MRCPAVLLSVLLTVTSCHHQAAPTLAERNDRASQAVAELQAAQFTAAAKEAEQVIAADPSNPLAHLVLAIASYRQVAHDLYSDGMTIVASIAASALLNTSGFSQRIFEFAVKDADERLAKIDEHLKVAAQEPELALPLCLACWEVDWNRDGQIDERDRMLLQVEVDADGRELDEGDPRRTPTFRFDVADVHWARAMIAFQRAAMNVALAYEWSDVARLFLGGRQVTEVRIPLVAAPRIANAKSLVLLGLDEADACRVAVLAETDDDREWLPSPRQKSHPLPLPVDDALFATWAGVIADTRDLMSGKTGLSVREIAQLGDEQWQDPPRGFVNIGRLFDAPGDIVASPDMLEHASERQQVESVLAQVLGDKYVQAMPATPMLERLHRIKGELDRGEESFERKLRYLIWLN